MKINWSNALFDYVNDETSSYASIASKYGVSIQSVKNRAAKEDWQDLRRKTIQKVNQLLPEKVGESIAEVNARHARLGKYLQKIGLEAIESNCLTPKNWNEAKQALVGGFDLEAKALGLDNQGPEPQKFEFHITGVNMSEEQAQKVFDEWAK